LQFVLTGLATWTSSQTSSVTIGIHTGFASTITPGTATITAAYQGKSNSTATVIVTQFPLSSISVSPATVTIPQTVATQFTATGTFSDGSQQNLTSYATWATNPSSVATIATLGIATGISPGQAFVTAVFAGIVSPTPTNPQLTVTNATITSIAVTPANASVTVGAPVTYKAVGTFSDQSHVDLTSLVTWTSSDVTVATIATTGVASTVKPGSVTITATFNGVSGTTNLTVN